MPAKSDLLNPNIPQTQSNPTATRRFSLWVGFLLAVFLVLSVSSMVRQDVTYDEPAFYAYGRQILEQKTAIRLNSFHNSKMPVNALQALPQYLCDRFSFAPTLRVWGHQIPYEQYRWWLSRLVTTGFAVVLLLIIARWSLELYGLKGSVFSLALACFCPTLLAHGRYVTTDVPLAAMFLLAMYAYWKFTARPAPGKFWQASLALGFAQLTKYTAVLLFPLFAIAAFGKALKDAPGWRHLGCWTVKHIKKILLGISACLLIALLVINTGFLWESPMTPIKNYGMGTEVLKSVPAWVRNIPLPTAYGYFQGLALTIGYERHPERAPGRSYFMGKASYRRHPWYYPVALLLKTPLAFWGLLLISLWRRRCEWDEVFFLVVPALALFFYFTFFQTMQVGIRFLLPIFTFLYVFLVRLYAEKSAPLSRRQNTAVMILTAWFALSSLSYYPHYLCYFNELIGPRINAYRYLADSNLDWGQNNTELKHYLEAHAGEKITVQPKEPATGKIIVSANQLVGITDPEALRWLRENYKPTGHIAYSWLIFDVPSLPKTDKMSARQDKNSSTH